MRGNQFNFVQSIHEFEILKKKWKKILQEYYRRIYSYN